MAFHPYPRVIGALFNALPFGPPRGLTPASACPWVAHPASRPRRATERPVQTRSRCGSVTLNLAAQRDSLAHSTKGTPSHPEGVLRQLAGARFQVLFHSPPGVLFTFPSRYWSAIGHRRVFRLGGRAPQLPAGSHVPGGTRERGSGAGAVRLRGCNPLRPAFPCRSAVDPVFHSRRGVAAPGHPFPQPRGRSARALVALPGLAVARFRSPLLPGSRLVSLPRGTEMFQFPRLPPRSVCVRPRGAARRRAAGSPVRRPGDHRARAPPPGLSQLAASFEGFLCLGIHRAPWISFPHLSR